MSYRLVAYASFVLVGSFVVGCAANDPELEIVEESVESAVTGQSEAAALATLADGATAPPTQEAAAQIAAGANFPRDQPRRRLRRDVGRDVRDCRWKLVDGIRDCEPLARRRHHALPHGLPDRQHHAHAHR